MVNQGETEPLSLENSSPCYHHFSIPSTPHSKSCPCGIYTLLLTAAPPLPCLSPPCVSVTSVFSFPSNRQGLPLSPRLPGLSDCFQAQQPAPVHPLGGTCPGSPTNWGPLGLLPRFSSHHLELWLTKWLVGLGHLGFFQGLSQGPAAGQMT